MTDDRKRFIYKILLRYNWLLVCLCFVLIEFLIYPVGEFPLNDDWAYSKAVYEYVTFGKLKFSNLIAIPFISQFFIGVGVCKVFGFSHFILRLISIVTTLLSIYILNLILKKIDVKSHLHFFILIIFAFNPLVLSMGNTFLPDPIILFFSVISFYFMVNFFTTKKKWNLYFFVVFTVLGTLNRQTGVLIPFAFGIIFFISNPKTLKNIFFSISPLIINIIALYIYKKVAGHYEIIPGNYNLQLKGILKIISEPSLASFFLVCVNFLTSIICLGILILPLTISNYRTHLSQIKKVLISKIIFIVFILGLFVKTMFTVHVLPFNGNIFYQIGIGPIIITGFNSQVIPEFSFYERIVYMVITIIGGTSFFFAFYSLIVSFLKAWKEKISSISGFFILLIFAYLIPICFHYANDRYLLFLIPFFFIAYVRSFEFELNKFWFLVSFLPIFSFSVLCTYDYINFHKTKSKALNHLTNELHISPELIDGGFEFNAWYFSDVVRYNPSINKRWWYIYKDDYIVSPKKRKGYTIESEYPLKSFISFSFKQLYVLKKQIK